MSALRLPVSWVLLATLACAPASEPPRTTLTGYAAATPGRMRAQGWRTDLSRLEVPLASIQIGPDLREGFRPMTDPEHARADEVELDPGEPVLVARAGGDLRAWPLVHLLEGELVRDRLNDHPVTVTFCSLCGSARVYESSFGLYVLQLAVSGLVLDGNALLYDEDTESLWSQLTGEAVAGEYAGERLEPVRSFVVSFGALREAHPAAPVMLAPEAGHGPAIDHLRAEHVERGELPPWLATTCPDPLAPVLTLDGRGTLELPAARVGSWPSLVVLHDATTAPPWRTGSGERAAPIGSFAAFECDLTLEPAGPSWRDRETGSLWNALGEAVEGPLTGKALRPARQAWCLRFSAP